MNSKPDCYQLGCEIPDLVAELWKLLKQIPPGRVTTYGRLAESLGSRQAAVWIGEYLLNHPHTKDCGCHRVVRHNGEIGLFISGNAHDKKQLLQKESVSVQHDRVKLKEFLFEEFVTDKPLLRLAEFQTEIPKHIRLRPFPDTPEIVAGVDISYTSAGSAVAACVLVETKTARVQESRTLRRDIVFPYVSGFLSFREIPVLLELFEQVESDFGKQKLIIVDGHGILHHRKAGIAAHLGVLLNRATIGVGKKLLCGEVDLEDMPPADPRPIQFENRTIGMAIKAKRTSRPIFISPGNRIDVHDSVRIVQQLFRGHRLPEPTYQADRISRAVAQGKSL